jgi:hypothetical protein
MPATVERTVWKEEDTSTILNDRIHQSNPSPARTFSLLAYNCILFN